ncbi:hypothetical protein DFH28DRAFT_263738 [Melampsora americana]|nr:hypothetical protein DFH28DRAFT_263738 [Melampsora americana]
MEGTVDVPAVRGYDCETKSCSNGAALYVEMDNCQRWASQSGKSKQRCIIYKWGGTVQPNRYFCRNAGDQWYMCDYKDDPKKAFVTCKNCRPKATPDPCPNRLVGCKGNP